jgi:GT2 family glycosyltransferase
MVIPRIRLVVPTLGQRVDYLRLCLESVLDQSCEADVVVVAPMSAIEARNLCEVAGVTVIEDPGGLSAAINKGAGHPPMDYEFINWLGDDDLLLPGALAKTRRALQLRPRAVLAFGRCRYVDPSGQLIGTSRAGRLAPWLMRWGPDLVPQPGMLVSGDAWRKVGGLDETLKYAMDLDLLLKLRQVGPFIALDEDLACFRWHPNSLTVADRSDSVREAEQVKRRYYGVRTQRFAGLWEPTVRHMNLAAGRRITRRAHRLSQPNAWDPDKEDSR